MVVPFIVLSSERQHQHDYCCAARYAETDAAGVEQPRFVNLEALMVKKDGRWLMTMERQLDPADQAAWDALA